MNRAARVLPLLLTLGACAVASRGAPRCQMSGATQSWIEGSLAAWDEVRERSLRLPPAATPPFIFFDRYCAYELSTLGLGSLRLRAGRDTLRGQGRAHGGRIDLPNGLTLPVRAEAFASLLPGDSATFLVMSLEDVWRRDRLYHSENEDWPAYLRRAFVHEMAHARQLVARAPMLRLAAGRVGLENFDDDVIQQRFDSVPGFREAVRNETALLFRAAATPSEAERRHLAHQAIRLMKERRLVVYGGTDAPWARVEQLLLDMEGAAQWAALAHVGRRSRLGPDARREIVRGSRQYWSQDQGLALYMVLDALVPDWSARMFSADPPTAIELIERALGPR